MLVIFDHYDHINTDDKEDLPEFHTPRMQTCSQKTQPYQILRLMFPAQGHFDMWIVWAVNSANDLSFTGLLPVLNA